MAAVAASSAARPVQDLGFQPGLLVPDTGGLPLQLVRVPAGVRDDVRGAEQAAAFLGKRAEGTQPFAPRGERVPVLPGGIELGRGLGSKLFEAGLALPSGFEFAFDDAAAGLERRFIRDVLGQGGLQLDQVVGQEAERASRTSNWTLWARRATSACLPSGVSCRRISPVRSLSRDRLACMASSLRTVFSLRRRCLRMPAASSMKPRRSSGVACRTLSSWPWPTITCISRPRPESESSSWISSSRQPAPLMAYSEPPVLKRVREIVTSLYSIGRAPSLLSMVSETCARPRGGRPEVPAKITSSILPPRSVLAPCSPMTQASASTTLDLPEPLGPTTAVTPGSNSNVVAEANDLNPRTVRLLRCKVFRFSWLAAAAAFLPQIYRQHARFKGSAPCQENPCASSYGPAGAKTTSTK